MHSATRQWCAQSGMPASLHYAVVAVWLMTAWVSWFDHYGFGVDLLAQSGMESATLRNSLIYAGAAWDALIGLGLLFWPSRPMYRLALLGMLVMTLVATVLQPSLWWHPLGPLFKNIPIAAVLWWGSQAPVAKPDARLASPAQ